MSHRLVGPVTSSDGQREGKNTFAYSTGKLRWNPAKPANGGVTPCFNARRNTPLPPSTPRNEADLVGLVTSSAFRAGQEREANDLVDMEDVLEGRHGG